MIHGHRRDTEEHEEPSSHDWMAHETVMPARGKSLDAQTAEGVEIETGCLFNTGELEVIDSERG